jgi:hypothetical protein
MIKCYIQKISKKNKWLHKFPFRLCGYNNLEMTSKNTVGYDTPIQQNNYQHDHREFYVICWYALHKLQILDLRLNTICYKQVLDKKTQT